ATASPPRCPLCRPACRLARCRCPTETTAGLMMPSRKKVAVLWLGAVLLGCGGSLSKTGGPDGATTTVPCTAMGACECMAASDRCAPGTEACWCPSECDPQIACIC